jgi:hypothetical protein
MIFLFHIKSRSTELKKPRNCARKIVLHKITFLSMYVFYPSSSSPVNNVRAMYIELYRRSNVGQSANTPRAKAHAFTHWDLDITCAKHLSARYISSTLAISVCLKHQPLLTMCLCTCCLVFDPTSANEAK